MAHNIVKNIEKLHDRAEEVDPITTEETLVALHSKLNKYKDLYALCAPQIGIKERIICIKFNDGIIRDFINPVINKSEGFHLVREKDVCFPEEEFINPRPDKIILQFQDTEGNVQHNKIEGVVAEVFDKLENYLDGFTVCDYGLKISEDFDTLTTEEQNEILLTYIEALQGIKEKVNQDIKNDVEAQKILAAIDFESKVMNNEITLVNIENIKEADK